MHYSTSICITYVLNVQFICMTSLLIWPTILMYQSRIGHETKRPFYPSQSGNLAVESDAYIYWIYLMILNVAHAFLSTNKHLLRYTILVDYHFNIFFLFILYYFIFFCQRTIAVMVNILIWYITLQGVLVLRLNAMIWYLCLSGGRFLSGGSFIAAAAWW